MFTGLWFSINTCPITFYEVYVPGCHSANIISTTSNSIRTSVAAGLGTTRPLFCYKHLTFSNIIWRTGNGTILMAEFSGAIDSFKVDRSSCWTIGGTVHVSIFEFLKHRHSLLGEGSPFWLWNFESFKSRTYSVKAFSYCKHIKPLTDSMKSCSLSVENSRVYFIMKSCSSRHYFYTHLMDHLTLHNVLPM